MKEVVKDSLSMNAEGNSPSAFIKYPSPINRASYLLHLHSVWTQFNMFFLC
jgi:hypothetical protein